jgi:D-cysteine desulfhydrase
VSAARPLFSRYPALARTLPHLVLADLPTPLMAVQSAAEAWDVGQLQIKRDDLSAPRYGGNKVRKLEFLLADARQRGCDAVITFGAVGSNHALATAIYARELGLRCYAVLTPQPASPDVARKLHWHALLGTRLCAAGNMAEVRERSDGIVAAHPGGADRVCRIPWGGSSWLGTVGFVNAALELAAQLNGSPPPDLVYAATGTMGTVVGLALGFRLLGWQTRIMAIRVVPQPVMNAEYFGRLFAATAGELHEREPAIPAFDDAFANVTGRDAFFGEGYAVPTAGTLEAAALARAQLGLELDTTYTGKAMAALIHDARAGSLRDRRVVFWQTCNSRSWPDLRNDAPELPGSFAAYLDA